MIYKITSVLLTVIFFFTVNTTSTNILENNEDLTFVKSPTFVSIDDIYSNLSTNNFELPKKESFTKAMEGYFAYKEKGIFQKEILTIVDYSLSSKENRLWVIDLSTNSILYQSLVAHGRNSGGEFANSFSNKPSSYKSSIGFYLTGETYYGKHGYSLRLDGLEKGVNNNARDRAIVVHGADYVSENFIKQHGRLGRSLGCLALSQDLTKEVIDVIKNNSCIFIYYPS